MNKNIKQLISSVMKGEARAVKSLVDSIISKRTMVALKEKKGEIASRMFQGKKKLKNLHEDVIDDLNVIIADGKTGQVKLGNGEVVDVDNMTANVLVTIFNAIESDEMREKFLDLANMDSKNFLKLVDFSWKNVE